MRIGLSMVVVMCACRFKDAPEPPSVVDTEVQTSVETDVPDDSDVPQDPVEDCTNGTDDDGDALPDCEDADCFGLRVCDEVVCDDAVDDDNDGLIDCADDDCWGDLACRVVREPMTSAAQVRYQFSGVGVACAAVLPPASFTEFVSVRGYAYTTVTIPDFQARVHDQVTGEVCTWTASQLVGRWWPTDKGMDPWPPRPYGLVANTGCTQPSSWVVPAYVRPHVGARLRGAEFVLNSVARRYGTSYGSYEPWLTLDLVQTHQLLQRVPARTYSFGSSQCRAFDLRSTTSWTGTVRP